MSKLLKPVGFYCDDCLETAMVKSFGDLADIGWTAENEHARDTPPLHYCPTCTKQRRDDAERT